MWHAWGAGPGRQWGPGGEACLGHYGDAGLYLNEGAMESSEQR